MIDQAVTLDRGCAVVVDRARGLRYVELIGPPGAYYYISFVY